MPMFAGATLEASKRNRDNKLATVLVRQVCACGEHKRTEMGETRVDGSERETLIIVVAS